MRWFLTQRSGIRVDVRVHVGSTPTDRVVLVLIAGVAVFLVGLANCWANTPYGRIKPIFAFTGAIEDRELPGGPGGDLHPRSQ